MDDFFADLLPSKPVEKTKSDSNATSPFHDDAVLPSKLDSPKSTMSQSSLDLMHTDNHKGSANSGHVPMGEPKMKKELKEYQQVMQGVVEGALKRFSTDLTRVLDEISRLESAPCNAELVGLYCCFTCSWYYRRLESVENQTEQLGQAAADAKEVDRLKEDSLKERLTTIEKNIRDIGRNVQLVRDRQVSGPTAPSAACCSMDRSSTCILNCSYWHPLHDLHVTCTKNKRYLKC